MCRECGCGHKGTEKGHRPCLEKTIIVGRSVTEANDRLASQLAHDLLHLGMLSVNFMGAPGSGKTTVIGNLCRSIPRKDVAVIQGDLESDVDKRRLNALGIDTAQINTHSGCHLNAAMVEKALKELRLEGKRFLFIENVGNLVCPAGVNVGQHVNVVVSSTTEGSDKPRKYPIIFRDADMIIISKYDLKKHVGFNETAYLHDLSGINPQATVVKASIKDGKGFMQAARFLQRARERMIGGHHRH
ncbi:MAG: hydrogenase nickel incorporation protein HypB [Candidatus Altiarchaeota archaeon]